ncbi:MAG: VWA domain-containing protein [Clostridia bacterium]|nr:VWA domain-containing protein [Clostridia bacterium]
MKNKLKKIIILSLVLVTIFSNAIYASDLNPGEVAFSKSAEWVDKENGIAKVTLKVEANPIEQPLDVVLVVDRSGSMGFSDSWNLEEHLSGDNGKVSKCMNPEHWINGKHYYDIANITDEQKQDRYDKEKGCINRYDVANEAVNTFLEEFYSRESSQDSRVALVTFNSNTDDIRNLFSPEVTTNQNFTNDKNVILNTMKTIGNHLGGGTNYTKALEKAQEYIAGRDEAYQSRQSYIVFLTDGVPDPYYNDGISIATELKQNNVIIYSIGIGENVDTNIIKKLASSENQSDGYFTTTTSANDLINFYSTIAGNMKSAGTDAKVVDVIGEDFEYYEDEFHRPTATPSVYPENSEDGRTIEWVKKEITDTEKIYEFYIKLKDGEAYDNGTWNTNEKAELSYKDVNMEEKKIVASNPSLSRHTYFIEHYLENTDGTYPIDPVLREEYLTDEGETVTAIPKMFENYVLNENVEGTVLEDIIGENNRVVLKLYYQIQRSKVIVKYVDKNGNEIANEEIIEGIPGNKYSILRKKIEGYQAYGEDPENKEGIYADEDIVVTFIYEKESNTYEKIVDTSDINIIFYITILLVSAITIALVSIFGIKKLRANENK